MCDICWKKRWPHALKVCKTNKLKLWRELSQQPLDSNLHNNRCCSLWNRLVRNHEAEIKKCIIESRNLGAFYRYINNRLTHKDGIGAIVTSNNTILTDDTDKANEFNTYFASAGVVDDGNLPNCPDIVDDDASFTPVTISPRDSRVLFNREGPKGLLILLDTLVCVVYGMRSLSGHLYSVFLFISIFPMVTSKFTDCRRYG